MLRVLLAEFIEPTLEARNVFIARTAELLGWDFHESSGMSILLACTGQGEQAVGDLLGEAGVSVSPGAAFDVPFDSLRLAFFGADADQARYAAETLARLSTAADVVQLRPAPLPGT